MEQVKTYENFPCQVVLIANAVSLGIYLIGAYVIWQLGLLWFILYLLFIFGFEIRLLKGHCVNCYYYGKYCAFGKGKISSWFFKKGSPDKFMGREMTWKDLLPDLLVTLIPVITGVILLISNFNWRLLLALILLAGLASAGNGYVRSSLACKFCKQKEAGCPAQQLFDKNKK